MSLDFLQLTLVDLKGSPCLHLTSASFYDHYMKTWPHSPSTIGLCCHKPWPIIFFAQIHYTPYGFVQQFTHFFSYICQHPFAPYSILSSVSKPYFPASMVPSPSAVAPRALPTHPYGTQSIDSTFKPRAWLSTRHPILLALVAHLSSKLVDPI